MPKIIHCMIFFCDCLPYSSLPKAVPWAESNKAFSLWRKNNFEYLNHRKDAMTQWFFSVSLAPWR